MLDVIEPKKAKRKALSKRIRFEVLKRDRFRCKYCGMTAEEVTLHVDHIKAVATGGTNDIMNLVTACEGCNLGKTDKPLDDHSTVAASRKQAELLQEKREILEMMAEWHSELRDLDGQRGQHLVTYWESMTPGLAVADSYQPEIKKLLKRYSYDEIVEAMNTAVSQYLEFDNSGNCTSESFHFALGKVAPILKWQRKFKEDPVLEKILYIRGIARKRCPNYFPDREAMDLLNEARAAGVEIEDLTNVAIGARNYTSFREGVQALIEDLAEPEPQKEVPQVDLDVGGEAERDEWELDPTNPVWQTKLRTALTYIKGRSVHQIRQEKALLCDICGNLIEEKDKAQILAATGKCGKFHLMVRHHKDERDCEAPMHVHLVGDVGKFSGGNAISEFTSLLQSDDYDPRAIAEMMRRCLVPGYDVASPHFVYAIHFRVVGEYNADGCFWDWQLDRILVWLGANGPHLQPWDGSPESKEPIPKDDEYGTA